MSEIIYLAGPYSHPNDHERYARVQHLDWFAGMLMARGMIVFSPISHTHPIAEAHLLPTDWAYWKRYAETMLSVCGKLVVCTLDGRQQSVGVQGEIEFAKIHDIPIVYADPWNAGVVDTIAQVPFKQR